jgi:hypothetical protein
MSQNYKNTLNFLRTRSFLIVGFLWVSLDLPRQGCVCADELARLAFVSHFLPRGFGVGVGPAQRTLPTTAYVAAGSPLSLCALTNV